MSEPSERLRQDGSRRYTLTEPHQNTHEISGFVLDTACWGSIPPTHLTTKSTPVRSN